MKTQTTIRAAVAAFAFSMSMFMTAGAADNVCQRCEALYQECVNTGAMTPGECFTAWTQCVARGGATRPCPYPR